MKVVFSFVIGALLSAALPALALEPNEAKLELQVRSSDGVLVQGQVDRPPRPTSVVIMVAGTGPFDRDAAFGPAALGERRKLFRDLSDRLLKRGVITVRYDKRGVRFRGPEKLDRDLAITVTTATMAADLRAVYEWTRSNAGVPQRCIAFIAHSEGMAHVARLADAGTPPPGLVMGVGALMDSPAGNFRWNFAERDEHSLRLLDVDKDGRITNDEVRVGLRRTPAGVNGTLEPYLHPSGAWTEEDLRTLRAAQAKVFEEVRSTVLAVADQTPWPTAQAPQSSYQWWKSWFLDEQPVAVGLAKWKAPVRLHYGMLDSQTEPKRQVKVSVSALEQAPLSITLHPDRGHSLGSDVTYGPMDERLAEQLSDEIARWAEGCAEGKSS